MKLRLSILLSAAALISTVVLNGKKMSAQEQPPKPPIAKKVPKTTQIHGYTVTDDYAWLTDKEKKDKDVLAYLKAEADYADAMMKSTTGFQEAIYKEMFARIKETDENVPYRRGDYFYYTRTEQGKQYPIFCRKKGDLKAPEDVTKRSNKIFRHALGGGKHELLFEEKDELYNTGVGKTRSKGYIVVSSTSSTTSEMRYLPADKPDGELKLLLPRKENHEYYIDHLGDNFYIRTNDQGKNFRLVTAPVGDPSPKNWKEIIPHRKEVMLEDVDCYAGHYIAVERENGLPKFHVTDLKSGKSHEMEFQDPVYVAYPGANAEFNTTVFRYNYESFITPNSVYDYDVVTRKRELRKQQPVLGGYNQELYKSERVYATASDGVKVPISIVYKKDPKHDGQRPQNSPMLLEGYGSYGISNDVDFSSNRLSLLDRGVIFGIAHIRGGGELGKEWHDQGKMMAKKNTFTDFITAAEYLVNEKYTSKDRLIITGGSAGGLLMGAVTNMRPDLFKAVVSYVPFVDVMNTMLDASLPLTVGEYLEWGNPNEKPAYDYMRSYSPYDNIEAKAYPDMLVRTSLNDSQVMYWEPAKYVAKLREMKTDNNLLLFKIKLEPGGHGGASGRYDRLRDSAFDYAFILGQLGVTK